MSEVLVLGVGFLLAFVLARVVRTLLGSTLKELILVGSVTALIETYHFLLQPNVSFVHLPELPPETQLFLAAFGVGRVLIILLETFPVTRPYIHVITG